MAEEFAFRDGDRQGGAVHVDQRLIGAGRRVVDASCHQFLAHAGLAGDQHREIGSGHQRDLLAQRGHGRAGADELTVAARRAALQFLRDTPAMIALPLECLDEAGGAQRRASQRAENRQHLRVEVVEAVRLEGVGGERADDFPAVGQRAAETGVHAVVRVERADDVAVERIGKRAVGREAHRLGASQDHVEAGLDAAIVASRRGLGRETKGRHRRQVRALHAQQAGRVAGNHPADGVDDPCVAVGSRQGGGQVAGHSE